VDDEIERLYAVYVTPSDALYMPAGWGHLVVNVGRTFLVTADDSPVDFGEAQASRSPVTPTTSDPIPATA
jgi:oxalate decarboxylase/phosphoglucose isomerase-like protein (cupin superfamily)